MRWPGSMAPGSWPFLRAMLSALSESRRMDSIFSFTVSTGAGAADVVLSVAAPPAAPSGALLWQAEKLREATARPSAAARKPEVELKDTERKLLRSGQKCILKGKGFSGRATGF